jgi:hypothetical protein
MAIGRKTGGRKKGTPNKAKTPKIRELAQKLAQEHRLDNALAKMTLEFALECMRDESMPPGFRLDAAKAAMPFCHAKKAEEAGEAPMIITEIQRVIVRPNHAEDELGQLGTRPLPGPCR